MKIFESVADAKAAKNKPGQKIETKGYYTAGDGGSATYLVKTAEGYGGTPDGYGDHYDAAGNVLALQHNGTVNVNQFGAKGDGSTDDTAALQACVAYCLANGYELYAPAGKTYRVTSTVNMRFIPVRFMGRISSPNGVTALKLGGNASSRNNPPQYVFAVSWDDPNYWKTATNPQVQILGMKGQRITLEFTDYVQFYQSGDTGTDYSQAYSYYHGVHNKFFEIDSGDGTGGTIDGWFNENEIHLESVFFLKINDKNYPHNNNRFYGGTFEGNGKGDGVVMDIGKCANNKFVDMRFEGNPKIKFSAEARSNTVEYTWTSAVPSAPVEVEDLGSWNVVYNVQDNGRTMIPILNVNSKNLFTYPDGTNHLNGLNNLSVSGEFITATGWQLIYQSDLIPAKGCPEIAALIQNVQSGGIRVNLTAYDENLNVISSTEEDYHQVGTGTGHSFQPETGGEFYPSTDTSAGGVMFVNQTGSTKAAYVRVNVISGGSGVTCGSLIVYVRTNTSGAYTQDIGASKNIGVPAPATTRLPPVPVGFRPLLTSTIIAAGAVNEQSFTYPGKGIIANMPCACAPDANHSTDNAGLIFEAYASATDEITVRISNPTAGSIVLASGTRPRVTVFPQFDDNL